MPTEPTLKLGRRPPDARRLMRATPFEALLSPTRLPPYPAAHRWGDAVGKWPLFRNDEVGDCTFAAWLHKGMARVSEPGDTGGLRFEPTDADALAGYEAVGHYVPGDPATDNGCSCLDVVRYAQAHGVAGHRTGAAFTVCQTDHERVKCASFLAGGLYVGLNLPLAWRDNPPVWDVPPGGWDKGEGPGTWGGHAVYVRGADVGGLDLVSWGTARRLTWAAWDATAEEVHLDVDPLWFRFIVKTLTVSGVDLPALVAAGRLVA